VYVGGATPFLWSRSIFACGRCQHTRAHVEGGKGGQRVLSGSGEAREAETFRGGAREAEDRAVLSGDAARLGSRVRARFATRVVREAFEGETRGRPWKAEATRTSTAMATTAPPAMSVRKMLPNSVGPSSSSLS
jgi:hypothetical protein